MNLAHCFTLLRIFISPVFPVLYMQHQWFGLQLSVLPYLMLGLLVVCECSDVFDGMLARKRNEVTDLGKVLDPMADSITHISLFLTFTQGIVQLPLLLVFVFIYRDIFISTLRTLCALRGVALAARISGKLKAVIQAAVAFLIIALMIPYTEGIISLALFQKVSLFATLFAALYTIASMADYLWANRRYIKLAF